MLKDRTLGTRIIIPVALVTIIISAAFYVLSDQLTGEMIDVSLEEKMNTKIADIRKSQARISEHLLSQAALFSRADAVQQAFQQAHEGDINTAEDPALARARQQLREHFRPIQEGLFRHTDKQSFRMHFHLPSARSLVRLWKEQHASDDLSSFRNTVVTISEGSHDPIRGIEIGRGGFAIRGIAPVTGDDGRYLGSVELLSSYTPLVKDSISNEKEFIAVYMNKEFLPIATRLQDQSKHPVVDDSFVFVSSTDRDVTGKVVSGSLLSQGSEHSVRRREGDHVVTAFPIKDFSGQQVGVMAYVYDAGAMFSTLRSVEWGNAGLAAVLLIGVLGTLFVKVRSVQKPLQGMISGLRNASTEINGVTETLSSASATMAESSSQQASSLEETSSSLEQMSSQTKQNADNAGQADGTMKETAQVVESGVQSMQGMSQAMQDIKDSTSETSKIVKTIDDIAFQTNLLALNAAVEAARAGDAGKGFAVVAEEVRNLAQRSAEAAKNTSELIEKSQQSAENGVSVAEEVSSNLHQIKESSDKVSTLLSEISAASKEQSQGIDQVNNAVAEMDKVVQRNASDSEETASAAQELSSQARELDSMVSQLVGIVSGGNRAAAASGGGNGSRPGRASDGSGGEHSFPARSGQQQAVRSAGQGAARQGRPQQSGPQAGPSRTEQTIPLDEDSCKDF